MFIENLLIPNVLLRYVWDFLGNVSDPSIWMLWLSLIRVEKT